PGAGHSERDQQSRHRPPGIRGTGDGPGRADRAGQRAVQNPRCPAGTASVPHWHISDAGVRRSLGCVLRGQDRPVVKGRCRPAICAWGRSRQCQPGFLA
ncbi:MAG: hypothetical protein M8467_06205, partial [Anaerolineae bacterium]|nr:hypothetical protein [Anaerolineae bacterium]